MNKEEREVNENRAADGASRTDASVKGGLLENSGSDCHGFIALSICYETKDRSKKLSSNPWEPSSTDVHPILAAPRPRRTQFKRCGSG